MFRRGPTWSSYQETVDRAKAAQAELDVTRQQVEDLKTLNKQMLTEFQIDDNHSEVPIKHAKYLNGLGKYMAPVTNNLENHFRLIYDRSNELDLWAEQSPAFDGLVTQTFLDPAFSMSNHPRYFDYEPLRDNVATVRNYVMQTVLEGVDQRDPDQMRAVEKKMEQMGREIGVALQRDSLFKRPGSASLNVSDASEPGVGAAKIYELLVNKQASTGILAPVKSMFGYNYTDWGLPPVEASAFSKENVDAFCLGDFAKRMKGGRVGAVEAAELTQAARTARREADELLAQQKKEMGIPVAPETAVDSMGLSAAQKLSVFGAGLAGSAYSLDRVEKLPEPVKDRSVELAREIIDKMRISLGGTTRDQWLELPAETALAQNEAISSIAKVYAASYHTALADDPSIRDNPAVLMGNEAMGKLAYLTKQQAGMKLVDEGRMNDAQMVMAELENYPQSWKNTEGESVESLLAQMQTGLEMTHSAVQKAKQQGLEVSQQPPNAPQAQQPVDMAALLAQAQQQSRVQTDATRNQTLSPQQIEQLLQGGNMSATELDSIRQMQSQAAVMHSESPQPQSHAESVGRAATPSPAVTQAQGGYRSSVMQQQPDFMPKR